MNKTEFGAKLAGILVGIIALIVFVVNIIQDHKARRADRIDLWRKAAIQKILQEVKSNTLGIEELLTGMKSLAWDQLDIHHKDDITEEKIRVLLLEMIAMEILDQHSNDKYGLRFRTINRNGRHVVEDKSNDKISQRMTKLLQTSRVIAIELIYHPNYYTRETFYEEKMKSIEVDIQLYNGIIEHMIRTDTIVFNKKGKMIFQGSNEENLSVR